MRWLIFAVVGAGCVWVPGDENDHREENRAPVAYLEGSSTQRIVGVDEIRVTSERSFDPDEDRMGFSWRFTAPDGTNFIPESSGLERFFVPDQVGVYDVELTVTDESGLRDRMALEYVVYNTDPTPSVRTCTPEAYHWFYNSDSLRIEGAEMRTACIDFSNSYDVDSHEVALEWEMNVAPEGGEETLGSGTGTIRLILPVAGLYEGVATLRDPYGGMHEVSITLYRGE